LTSGYTTHTRVTFHNMLVIWHLVCDFSTQACGFDKLRVKLLYYKIYITLSYRYMPDEAHMLVESTLCAAL
jgi:hypothetical protein